MKVKNQLDVIKALRKVGLPILDSDVKVRNEYGQLIDLGLYRWCFPDFEQPFFTRDQDVVLVNGVSVPDIIAMFAKEPGIPGLAKVGSTVYPSQPYNIQFTRDKVAASADGDAALNSLVIKALTAAVG